MVDLFRHIMNWLRFSAAFNSARGIKMKTVLILSAPLLFNNALDSAHSSTTRWIAMMVKSSLRPPSARRFPSIGDDPLLEGLTIFHAEHRAIFRGYRTCTCNRRVKFALVSGTAISYTRLSIAIVNNLAAHIFRKRRILRLGYVKPSKLSKIVSTRKNPVNQ